MSKSIFIMEPVRRPLIRAAGMMLILCAAVLVPASARAEWGPLTMLAQDSSLLPYNNARGIAAGQAGTLHVVWWNPTPGGRAEIFYRRSTDYGNIWSQKIQLSSNVGGFTDCPAIAARGPFVHVVWEDGNGYLYYNRSTDAGSTWAGQVNLSGITPWAHMPSLAVNGSAVHAVWADRRNGGSMGRWFIYHCKSTDNGATWEAPDSLTMARTEDYGDPSPSVSASGSDIYVAWQDFRDLGASLEVYFKRSRDLGATWSADTRLTNGAYSPYFTPRPVVASSDSFVHLVWEETGGDTIPHLYYMRSTNHGALWSGGVRIEPDTLWGEQAALTASGGKVYAACWGVYLPTAKNGVYYVQSPDNGSSWAQDTFIVSPWDSLPFDHPSIAVSEPDTVRHLIFGTGNPGWGRSIYYSRWGSPPIGIEAESGSPAGPPAPSLKPAPNPFVSFASVPGRESEFFSLFDLAGREIGKFRGGRIGEGIPAGVYFLKPIDGTAGVVRLVKVR